jgi:hypothetical protein
MDKEIKDVNISLQFQNDMLKKELYDKQLYINTIENELDILRSTSENTINLLKETIKTIQLESEKLKNNNQINSNNDNKSYLSYVYSIFK